MLTYRPRIDDGFTQFFETDGFWMEFRPLLSRQRQLLLETLHRAGGEDRLLETARNCVISCSHDPESLPSDQINEFAGIAIGLGQWKVEANDAETLRIQASFQFKHRDLAGVSCDFCRKYWFDPISVELTAGDGLHPVSREGTPTLCETGQSCPAGHYSSQRRLQGKYRQAVEHFLACDATGMFPDDPIVARNAGIIRGAMNA